MITAYAILFGGFLLLGGRLADLLGRRRLFVAGVALFTRQLAAVRARLVGGVADRLPRAAGPRRRAARPGGALDPRSTTFREGRERNLALGVWGAASGSGGAAGVLLGGVLTSYLELVVDLLHQPPGRAWPSSRVSPLLLPREPRRRSSHRHFDFAGAASITAGLMLLVYAITRASQHGWSDGPHVGLLAVSVALIARVLRDRVPLAGAAPAAADLPPADALGRQRHHAR